MYYLYAIRILASFFLFYPQNSRFDQSFLSFYNQSIMTPKKIRNKITQIKKRDGRIADFSQEKITSAIFKALTATDKGGKRLAKKLSNKVVEILNKRTKKDEIPEVENVQDIVEEILILEDLTETAKAYILYREQRRRIRESKKAAEEALETIDSYIEEQDWQIKENANMAFSLQGLNHYLTSAGTKKYWLNKIYPEEIREPALDGDFHLHNLDTLSTYCCGWDLYDLLLKGFGGVATKVESKPAKHFRTALGQLVNFFYTLQGESAGAQAVSSFDTLLAPFIRYDNLNFQQTKQAMQEFIFNCAVPTRVGFQTPFLNVTLDINPSPSLANQSVIIGGEVRDETYGEFQEEMDVFNQAFAEVMSEGDANGRVFTFPIPTINITKDFDWENSNLDPIWKMTAKYGIPYFANFIHSDMKPEDVRSMCPLSGNEKVLTKSTRGRDLEFSSIKNIYYGNPKNKEYKIYSHGRFVKGRFNKFPNQEMIKVTLDNNHKIEISKKHLNFTLRDKKSKVEILKGEELKEGMYLPYSLKKYKGSGCNEDLGYFVGAFAGDGSFDKDTSVVFSLENERKKHVIEKLKFIGDKYFGAHFSERQDSRTKLYTLKIHSRAAVGLCKDFVAEKEREKHYKEKLFTMSLKFRRGVLKGHYDTDGGNRNRIYTSSEKMVKCLNMLAATMGTTTSIYKDSREGRLGKNPNYAVLIYQLNRKKYGKIWFKKGDKLWVRVKRIQKLGKSMAYCFEVRNDEPMFTVGTTGILTHNCRLRLSNKELYKRGGGLFGSNPLTGSIGVVTINMPRIGYLAKNKKEFFERLSHFMDLAKESLEIKRKALENFTAKGLYPYSKYYLAGIKKIRGDYWGNHFSTIGLAGMNEALLNFLGVNIGSQKGRKFTLEVLDFMRKRLIKYQEETGSLYNLEATPAESTSYRLARLDRKKYPDIITAGKKEPYYTNSTQLPVNYTDDLFEALKLQDEIQTKYTGGTVFHNFIGEKISNGETVKRLVKKVFENFKLPYFTITPTFSICPHHGYIAGEHFTCPKCTIEQPCEVYSRVVGYLRPVKQWNLGKQEEFKERKEFKIK